MATVIAATATSTEYILDAKTTLRLPDEMLRELKHLAIDDHRTLTELVVEALNDYLEKRSRERK